MSAAPTAWELLSNLKVLAAIEQAWIDSLPADSQLRHEEGGWIYANSNSGELEIRRAPSGTEAEIDLTSPSVVEGYLVVAMFHTHPNPMREGWMTGPSDSDAEFANRCGVANLVRAEDGIHLTGPSSRRGGLTGNPGYPDIEE